MPIHTPTFLRVKNNGAVAAPSGSAGGGVITAAWTEFTPAVTSLSGPITQPIGLGLGPAGIYIIMGNLCIAKYNLYWAEGMAEAGGAGAWNFSLPVPAADRYIDGYGFAMPAAFQDEFNSFGHIGLNYTLTPSFATVGGLTPAYFTTLIYPLIIGSDYALLNGLWNEQLPGIGWVTYPGGEESSPDNYLYIGLQVEYRCASGLSSGSGGGPGGGGGGGGGGGIDPPPPPEPGSFTDYKLAVLAEMVGYGVSGSVSGGLSATTVISVTTTADSGAGSLREALLTSGERYIVFDATVFPPSTPTTITLSSAINMGTANSNVTVDGYGCLVEIDGYDIITGDYSSTGMSDICENVVFVNIRHNGGIPDNHDCWTVDGTSRFWFHHCEARNAGDGSIDITGVGSAATAFGMGTISNCIIANTGKNFLVADQTFANSDYDSPTSTTHGGDCRITMTRNNFFGGNIRNPSISNYWVDFVNNWVHNYGLEGTAVVGMCAMVRTRGNVFDGTGATNPVKGFNVYDESFGGFVKNTKWYNCSNDLHLGGSTINDTSSFSNPDSTMTTYLADGTFFTLVSFITPTGGGNNLTDDLGDSDLTNVLRAGQIDRLGYWDLVI